MALRSIDLMIGDWIHNNVADITFQVYPQFFIQWHNRSEQFEAIIQPIPLTPEILEKNGFSFTKNNNTDSIWNGWWIYEGLELAVANLNKEGNWPCFINIYDSNILCEYVHQLQHALRLCGIEKEIEI